MGIIKHHAIVVTASYRAPSEAGVDQGGLHWIEVAHGTAAAIFDERQLTEPTPEGMNGYRSFLIAPDGSKEGWDTSDEGDLARDRFVCWMRNQAYADGSCPLTWVEVFYGSEIDDPAAQVVAHDEDGAR